MNSVRSLSFLKNTDRYNPSIPQAQDRLHSIFQSKVNRDKLTISPVSVESVEELTGPSTSEKQKKVVSFKEKVSVFLVPERKEYEGIKEELWRSPEDYLQSKEESKLEIVNCVKRLEAKCRVSTKEIVYTELYQPESMKIHSPLIELE